MEIKIKMHTLLNRLAFWCLFPIFIVAGFFIFKDAANNTLKIAGLAVLFVFFVGYLYLFVFKLCIYDYVIFKQDGIQLHSPFRKKAFFKYNEVNACCATYTSVIEKKKYFTFTDKKHNAIVTHVDTSTTGNVIALNKMQVVYVPANEKIVDFLKEKQDLQWFAKQ